MGIQFYTLNLSSRKFTSNGVAELVESDGEQFEWVNNPSLGDVRGFIEIPTRHFKLDAAIDVLASDYQATNKKRDVPENGYGDDVDTCYDKRLFSG